MIRKLLFITLVFLCTTACRADIKHINVRFDHSYGLVQGDRVLFDGKPVGQIAAIDTDHNGAKIMQLKIAKTWSTSVTQYSEFHVIDDPTNGGRKAIKINLWREGGVPLADKTLVNGVSPSEDLSAHLRKEVTFGLNYLKSQIKKFGRDLQQIPESQEYQNLKKNLEDLASEIGRAGKKTRDKIRKELLPQIQKDLQDLKEHLRKYGRENELLPLEEEVDRIRKI